MSAFFEIRSSRDMLSKLLREHERLRTEPNIDNVFNFYVTAFHLKDYLKEERKAGVATISEDDWNALESHPDLKASEHLCNKGKHVILSQGEFRNRPNPVTEVESGAIGDAALNAAAINSNPEWRIYYPDTKDSVPLLSLADRVVGMWEVFFASQGL